MLDQGVVNRVFLFCGGAGQGDEFLGPTVVLAAFVVHDAATQRKVSRLLVAGADGGVHVQTTGVNLGTVLRKHQLARHLGHVLGVSVEAAGGGANFQFFLLGRSGFGFADEAMFFHALNDVELA